MNLENLKSVLKNQPKFRYKQVDQAIYHDLIEKWEEATNLPLNLRKELEAECPLEIKAEISGRGDSIKALLTLRDGLKIETVLMKHKDERNTVCVSSQVGCPMGCLFCATGKIGFKRNLEASEIVEQVLFFSRFLNKTEEKVTNVVFMGMGEPFLNYENVIKAIRFMNSEEGFNLGARRFSISTAGVIPGIKNLAKEDLEVNLALSLHAVNNDLRSVVMPINKKYPIAKVMAAIDEYIEITRRRVMFEYVLINEVNDSPENARQLAGLLKGKLGFVNLIPYNKNKSIEILKPSTPERIKKFKEILEKEKVAVIQRQGFGQGIDAACGQLAGRKRT